MKFAFTGLALSSDVYSSRLTMCSTKWKFAYSTRALVCNTKLDVKRHTNATQMASLCCFAIEADCMRKHSLRISTQDFPNSRLRKIAEWSCLLERAFSYRFRFSVVKFGSFLHRPSSFMLLFLLCSSAIVCAFCTRAQWWPRMRARLQVGRAKEGRICLLVLEYLLRVLMLS